MYQNCIDECDYYLNSIDDSFLNEKTEMLKTKASLLHNIGDLLQEESYLYESIELYKNILNIVDKNTKDVLINKIDNGYKVLHKIYTNKSNIFKAKDILNKISDKKSYKHLEIKCLNKALYNIKNFKRRNYS